MKKYFWRAAICCCAMIASVALTACGGDDDEPDQDNKAVKVALKFNFTLSQDIIDYCDVVVTYNDGTGEKTETMTSTTWSKTLSSKLPATFTFNRKVTLKSGKDLSKVQSVKIDRIYSYAYELFNAAGKAVNTGSYNNSGGSLTMSGAAAVEMVNSGRMDDSRTCAFTADGQLVQ